MGAPTGAVFRLVAREALTAAALGVAAGLGAALVLGRSLSTLLYEIAPTDAGVLMGGAGVVLAVALSACWRPAWRATRVDPMTVLRAE